MHFAFDQQTFLGISPPGVVQVIQVVQVVVEVGA